MSTTLMQNPITFSGRMVLLPFREYQELKRRAEPIFYLKGKQAVALDRLVIAGLKDYHNGRTRKIRSLSELA